MAMRDKFGHSLGHGTGLAVHESPRLSPIKDDRLKARMVVTVEPGIYIFQGGGACAWKTKSWSGKTGVSGAQRSHPV
jgi:Xaa-Pro aminopeptidase